MTTSRPSRLPRGGKSTVALASLLLGCSPGLKADKSSFSQNSVFLTVDAAADRHPISPDIYGVNAFGTESSYAAFLKEAKITVNRWGGDAATRYNWLADATNAGDDWFFMAGADKPSGIPGNTVDQLVAINRSAKAKSVITLPILDYVNKAVTWDCSYPVSLFGKQEKVNPYVHPVVNGTQTDAGNGKTPDGKPIVLTKAQILRVHVPNSPDFQRTWVQHFLKKYGTAAEGGVSIYELDNEPSGWGNTHRDVHPGETGYDELIDRSIPYAAMVKAADPEAKIDGPGDFGWPVYLGGGKPGDNKESHNNLGFAEYYLRRMSAYEKKNGVRLLDYFDEHYYPASDDGTGGLANSPAGDAATQKLRLQSTRSLWDPTYVEKNWIGKYNGAIRLIPRFHEWVDKNYPGTKIAITEYNFGGLESLNGALAQADVLGIFGREQLDLATLWGPPKPTEPGAFAFRMFRNFDGQGGAFGETSVKAVSSDSGQAAVYGAERKKDGALTLLIVNKTDQPFSAPVKLSGLKASGEAKVYHYSAADLKAIVRDKDIAVEPSGFTVSLPAFSLTMVVFPASR